MVKESYEVRGMTCSACSARVEKFVSKVVGEENVSVNLLTNTMQVKRDEKISVEKIIKAVENAGYEANLKNIDKKDEKIDKISVEDEMKHRLKISIIFLLPTIYVSMHEMLYTPEIISKILDGYENAITYTFLQFLLILPIMYVNRKYYVNGFKNIKNPNMDTLVGLGSMSAAIFGIFAIFMIGYGLGHGNLKIVEEYARNVYFESAGMIVTLITFGKYLESRAKNETTRSLKNLMKLTPKTAKILKNGEEVEILVENLKIGDEIVIRPGEIISADGEILDGETTINESAITGESLPVNKKKLDKVTSGTLNLSGFIKIRAEKVGEDSTIQKIISLVEEASSSKAPIAKLADKISGVFVPVVIILAILSGILWIFQGATIEFAFSIGISILVISCPCALGLATPVAIMVGMGKGAENGILIKSGEILQKTQEIDTIVVDKTGTLTEGKPYVTDVIFEGELENFLEIASGLEKNSEHPISRAIMKFCEEKGILPREVKNFKAVFGRGIIAGKYICGNEKFLIEKGVKIEGLHEKISKLENEGKTAIIFAEDEKILGIVGISDIAKKSSEEAVKSLKNLGLEIIMLTGDNYGAAKKIAKKVGIEKFFYGLSPAEKSAEIEKIQREGKKVAMIGDGINDAPSLVKSDVGIAIGAGTDVAIESADAVLIKSNLMDAVSAIKLSRAVMKNIKENLFWAFFYNIVCIPIAAGVFYTKFGIKLTPMIGAAAMSFSSICVVMNALRLKFFKVEKNLDFEEKLSEEVKIEKSLLNDKILEVGEKMTTTLKIEGMMCKHCQKHVYDALSQMDGVTGVEVSLEEKNAVVNSEKEIPMDEFKKVIEDAGYEIVA